MTRDEEMNAVLRAQNGDPQAFELLVLTNQKHVYNLALKMVNNEDDALDIAQDVFLRAYTAIGGFRGDSRFSVWLFRLTSNICIDFLRQRQRRRTGSLTYMDEDDQPEELEIPDERFTPEREFERREMNLAISRALSELPPALREIVILREINGLSYEEIGEVMSLEVGTVKSRLFRARKKLCLLLLEDGNISVPVASYNKRGGVRNA